MFTPVKIDDFLTYWPINETQAARHHASTPFGYRTYYLRILPRYGALTQGWFYDFFQKTHSMRLISFKDTFHCGDCWVYIFDDLHDEEDELGCVVSGAEFIVKALKNHLIDYSGKPLPDLELVHPINRYVLFSLGVFSGNWQYNKLIAREG